MAIENRPPLKAYQNPDFINSDDARIIRMLSEYLEPASRLRLHRVHDTIVFFGSARIRPLEEAQKSLANLQAQLRSDCAGGARGSSFALL
jgi:hypothetical protein